MSNCLDIKEKASFKKKKFPPPHILVIIYCEKHVYKTSLLQINI